MKAQVFLPEKLAEEAEAAAKELQMPLSGFIRMALSDYLARQKGSETTRRLNDSYTKHPPEPDPFLDYLVLEGMKRTEWKD
jgi:hypothetical protein